MLRRIKSTIAFLAIILTSAQAQEVCNIHGKIENLSLSHTNSTIKKVYLTRIDEYNRHINIDSAKVKKGKYKFKYNIQKDEPTMLYLITGFDNGYIPFFAEPGEVTINTAKASMPLESSVEGTQTNNLYKRYKEIAERHKRTEADSVKMMQKIHGDTWLTSPEGQLHSNRLAASAAMQCTAEQIKFLLDNSSSPIAPLIMSTEIQHLLSDIYATQLLRSLPTSIQNHPYYRELSNKVLARQLKEGNEVPDITIPLRDGTMKHLSDFRGRYVLLDFWASWCGPCIREITNLKKLYDETREHKDKFTILSFSLDKKEEAWRDTIAHHNIDLEGWIHCSDLMGGKSPSAQLFNVEMIPHMILIDPEGKAISFSLSGEELVRRVKQILSGDLYYLNDKKE